MVQHPFLNPSATTWTFEANPQERFTEGEEEDGKKQKRLVSAVGLQAILSAVAYRFFVSPLSCFSSVNYSIPNESLPRSVVLTALTHVELSNLQLEESELLCPSVRFLESMYAGLPWLQKLSLEGNYLSDLFVTQLVDIWKENVSDRNRQRRVFAARARRSMKLMTSSMSLENTTSLLSGTQTMTEALPIEEREVALTHLNLSRNRIGDDGAFALTNALANGAVAPHLREVVLSSNPITARCCSMLLAPAQVPANPTSFAVNRRSVADDTVRRRAIVLMYCLKQRMQSIGCADSCLKIAEDILPFLSVRERRVPLSFTV